MEYRLLENPDLNNSAEEFFGSINKRTQILYIIILIFLALTAGLMTIIRVPVYLESRGTFRPDSEKKQICSTVQGIIEKIFVEENQKIRKDDVILIINTEKEKVQLSFVNRELIRTKEWLKDCSHLANNFPLDFDSLRTPKYQSEFIMYQQEQQILEFEIKQLMKDIDRLKPMEKDSMISKKEMEEIELKYSSLVGKLKSNINYKRNQWQDQMENYRQKLISLSKEKYSLEYYLLTG